MNESSCRSGPTTPTMVSLSRCRACWGGPGLNGFSNHRCPPTNDARCCSARKHYGRRWQASHSIRTGDVMDENSVSHATTPEASPALVVALVGLTFVTGVIDAVSFLGLGHVFTANMTGNVVLLGFAL